MVRRTGAGHAGGEVCRDGVCRLETTFQLGIAALRHFLAREGHARVPTRHVEPHDLGGFKLGNWSSHLRSDYAAGKLTPSRTRVLKDLGFVWSLKDDDFKTSLEAFRQFVMREGHGRIPTRHVEDLEGSRLKLGSWSANLRRAGTEGLTGVQVKALVELQFDWNPVETDFREGLVALSEFVAREAHGSVPRLHVEPVGGVEYALGSWANSRRRDRKRGRLDPAKVAELDSLGFDWDPTETKFRRGAKAFVTYAERMGHGRVPKKHVETADGHPVKLGSWCQSERTARREGKLDPRRIAVLEEWGFDWDPLETDCRRGLEALRLYRDREGHCRVPKHHVEALPDSLVNLGMWCANRRTARRKQRLSDERMLALDEVGFE